MSERALNVAGPSYILDFVSNGVLLFAVIFTC